MASTPASASWSPEPVTTSPTRKVTPRAWSASSLAVTAAAARSSRTSATTWCPPPTSSGTTCEPTNPLAPVTRTVDIAVTLWGWPATLHGHHDTFALHGRTDAPAS